MATPCVRWKVIHVLIFLLLHYDNILCDDDDGSDVGSRSGEDDTCDDLQTSLQQCCQKRHMYGPTKVCATTCHTWSCWTGVFHDECNFVHKMCRYYSDVSFELYYHEYNEAYFRYQSCNGDHVPTYIHMFDCFPYTGYAGMDMRRPIIYNVPRYDIITRTDSGKPTAVVYWEPLPYARDNSGAVKLASNMSPGDAFPIGDTKVTYIAIDSSGNRQSTSFTVTVKDKEKPVITSDLSVIHLEVKPGETSTVVSWPVPIITDNSGLPVIIVSNKYPGDVFPIGMSTVTYTATDAFLNSAEFSFDILITNTLSLGPIIYDVPKNNIITETDSGKPTAVVYWEPLPYARDDSGAVTLTSNMSPGDVFPIGDTKVTYIAIDSSGNTASDSFTVAVKDVEKPIIISDLSVINLETKPGETSTVVSWSVPIITDNSGLPVTIVSNKYPGDVFPIGMSTVTYTATDAFQNSAEFSFDILITKSDRTPQPPLTPRPPTKPACSCEIAPGNLCQISGNTTPQSMVKCTNATLHSLKYNCPRCQKAPPIFPDCSFPEVHDVANK
ncbi:hyalin-like [Amphiura filiformis]|uniref:hyalin-like n=1 Tax=Amphiura filiformis TaxID=82378 RepID=UPI003B215449